MKAILDIETGGFSITKNGICEIAMILIDDNFNIISEFQTYIKPYFRDEPADQLVSYKDDAMAVNGLTVEFLEENGIDVEKAAIKLLHFIEKNKITEFIGHNIRFDFDRIEYLIKRFTFMKLNEVNLTDTLKISRENLSLKKNDLVSVCNSIGIATPNAHGAIPDCYSVLELLKYFKH